MRAIAKAAALVALTALALRYDSTLCGLGAVLCLLCLIEDDNE